MVDWLVFEMADYLVSGKDENLGLLRAVLRES